MSKAKEEQAKVKEEGEVLGKLNREQCEKRA